VSEKGEALFNSVSIDVINNASNSESVNVGPKKSEWVRCLSEDAKFSDGDVFETLYTQLSSKFSARDCEIFYRTFGLNGFDEDKGKDIADMYGISRSLVSIKVNKIIAFIRNNEELVEILSNLLK
jgi:DNA-directed RNA polymerase specialized sigma subunit